MTASTAHSSRILIVEDVQETRDSIRELLTRDGYCVDPARDEEEAVDRVSGSTRTRFSFRWWERPSA